MDLEHSPSAVPAPEPAAQPPEPAGRPTTVLFDLDGTLIDSIELILNSVHHAFDVLGRPRPTDAEWLSGVGIPLRTMVARYATDEADCDRIIAGYREYQYANHDRLIRCYDGVPDVIRQLHRDGHDIGIVTSKSEALTFRALVHVGLAHYVDTVVGCDGTTRHKPDPEPVRMALNRLGCPPEQAIFVGDSVHDIRAGNAAGVRTAAALWGAFSREDLARAEPTFYLTTVLELFELTGPPGRPAFKPFAS